MRASRSPFSGRLSWLPALLLAAVLQFSMGVPLTHAYEHLPASEAHPAGTAHIGDPAEHAADLLCLDCVAATATADMLVDGGATACLPSPGLVAATVSSRPFPASRARRARNRSPPTV